MFVLLFPFYLMVMTSFKSNEELMSKAANPFWIVKPTLDHFEKLLFRTEYPQWLWNTILNRKSTRLNSSHLVISYAVFCLKKKNNALQLAPLRHEHLAQLQSPDLP